MLILNGKSSLTMPEIKEMVQSINQKISDSFPFDALVDTRQYENHAQIISLLEQQLESQNEQIEIQKKQLDESINSLRPDYVNRLIESGLVYIDGVTALESLDKIADYLLNEWKMDFLSPELLMQFRQKDGKSYSINSAKEAVKRAKVQEK